MEGLFGPFHLLVMLFYVALWALPFAIGIWILKAMVLPLVKAIIHRLER